MKKLFLTPALILFFCVASFAQNIINTTNSDNSQLGNNPGNVSNTNDLADNNINYSDQLSNNPASNLNINNDENQVQYQQQFSIQSNNNQASSNFAVFSSSGNKRVNTYTTYGSSAKKHSLKIDLKLNKIHFLRKFRKESPLFKAKTYTKIFTSKKRHIRKCFKF